MDYSELPNQVVEDYSFDAMDRLVRMRQLRSDSNNRDLSDNEPRADYHYTYDPDRDPSATSGTDGKRYGLSETFVIDFVGNRLSRNVDYAYQSAIDQYFKYVYDSNDRLLEETRDDSDTGAGTDQTTVYEWGVGEADPDGTTQQIGKTVTDVSGNIISRQRFAYNLQGRMHKIKKGNAYL